MKSDEAVAEIQLLQITNTGDQRHVGIRVGKPRHNGSDWECPLEIKGLHTSLPAVRGQDSLQSLCLALRLVSNILYENTLHSRFFYGHEGADHNEYEFPIESYFGKFSRS